MADGTEDAKKHGDGGANEDEDTALAAMLEKKTQLNTPSSDEEDSSQQQEQQQEKEQQNPTTTATDNAQDQERPTTDTTTTTTTTDTHEPFKAWLDDDAYKASKKAKAKSYGLIPIVLHDNGKASVLLQVSRSAAKKLDQVVPKFGQLKLDPLRGKQEITDKGALEDPAKTAAREAAEESAFTLKFPHDVMKDPFKDIFYVVMDLDDPEIMMTTMCNDYDRNRVAVMGDGGKPRAIEGTGADGEARRKTAESLFEETIGLAFVDIDKLYNKRTRESLIPTFRVGLQVEKVQKDLLDLKDKGFEGVPVCKMERCEKIYQSKFVDHGTLITWVGGSEICKKPNVPDEIISQKVVRDAQNGKYKLRPRKGPNNSSSGGHGSGGGRSRYRGGGGHGGGK